MSATGKRVAAIVAAWREGQTIAEIGRRFGVAPEAVADLLFWRDEMGEHWTPEATRETSLGVVDSATAGR